MKGHVPDLERCKRLQEKGFPQDKSLMVYALTEIRSEDPKHRHNEWIAISRDRAVRQEIDGDPYYQLIAAPIVTELVGEIGEVQVGAIEIAYRMRCHSEDWMWNVSICYLPESSTNADTLPNALADLWIWLRERGE